MNIYLPKKEGESILIDGQCYEFVGMVPGEATPGIGKAQAVFDNCNECTPCPEPGVCISDCSQCPDPITLTLSGFSGGANPPCATCNDVNIAHVLDNIGGCIWHKNDALPSGDNYFTIDCNSGMWDITANIDLVFDATCWLVGIWTGSIEACGLCPPLGVPIPLTHTTVTSGSCDGPFFATLS
jgi:hypothetical protein